MEQRQSCRKDEEHYIYLCFVANNIILSLQMFKVVVLNMWAVMLWVSNDFLKGSAKAIRKDRRLFTLWFLTIAKLQSWNSNVNNVMVGGQRNLKNCINGIRKVENHWFEATVLNVCLMLVILIPRTNPWDRKYYEPLHRWANWGTKRFPFSSLVLETLIITSLPQKPHNCSTTDLWMEWMQSPRWPFLRSNPGLPKKILY